MSVRRRVSPPAVLLLFVVLVLLLLVAMVHEAHGAPENKDAPGIDKAEFRLAMKFIRKIQVYLRNASKKLPQIMRRLKRLQRQPVRTASMGRSRSAIFPLEMAEDAIQKFIRRSKKVSKKIDKTSKRRKNKLKKQRTDAHYRFSTDLCKKIDLVEKDSSYVMSPYSITMALVLVWNGALNTTSSEIRKALRYDMGKRRMNAIIAAMMNNVEKQRGHGIVLQKANNIFVAKQMELKHSYTKVISANFDTMPTGIDFNKHKAAQHLINAWTEYETEFKIKNFMPDGALNKRTRAVIVNALYFKGPWQYKFAKEKTKEEEFHVTKKKKKMVKMMHLDTVSIRHYGFSFKQRSSVFTAIDLPYANSSLSMVFILPKYGRTIGDIHLEKGGMKKVLYSLDNSKDAEIAVSVPKFKIETQISLKNVLRALGIKRLFQPKLANLGGITNSDKLYVSDVLHKTMIEVAEEGTEAAAATAILMNTRREHQPAYFFANRPFYFLLREKKTKAVLFFGRVLDPSEL